MIVGLIENNSIDNLLKILDENTCMNDIIKNNTFWIGNFDDMDFLKIKQIIYSVDEKF